VRLYSVNEFNILAFLARRLMRQHVYALCVFPIFPPLEGLLRGLVNLTARAGIDPWAANLVESLELFEKNPAEVEYAHIYPRYEAGLNEVYGIGRVDLDDYTYPYQHAASSWLKFHLGKLVRLNLTRDRMAAGEVTVQNLPRDLLECYEVVYGQRLNVAPATGRRMNATGNLVITVAMLFATFLAILKRTRISTSQRDDCEFILGADLSHEDARSFFTQIIDEADSVIFLARNAEVTDSFAAGALAKYHHITPDDGHFSGVGAALQIFGETVLTFWKMYAALWQLETGLYFSIVKLVHHRVKFRALFNCFKMQGFLARDEYNPEHIVRTQELRRQGILSLGLTHGMSTGPRVYPHTRYLDFDILYVFGNRQREAYADTWSSQMRVRPIGAFRPSRKNWADKTSGRRNEILIFGNQDTDPPRHIEIAREIARAFPDRKITVKLKYRRDYIGASRYDPYIEQLGVLPENVEVTDQGRPYEMMLRAGYSFSGLSTVVAEAVQLGMCSFFIDVYDTNQDIFFRDFPDLCVNSADTAIRRIQEIESDVWRYPREAFADLIECSSENPFDKIRVDLGLPPWPYDKEAVVPAKQGEEIRRVAS